MGFLLLPGSELRCQVAKSAILERTRLCSPQGPDQYYPESKAQWEELGTEPAQAYRRYEELADQRSGQAQAR